MAAIENFIPEIWSARYTRMVERLSVFAGLCNQNYMGEVAEAGDTVKIPTFDHSNITVSDYTRDTPLSLIHI